MPRLQSVLGYAGAILTVVLMLLMPFVLFGLFTHAVARTGVQVDPVYSGGAPADTIAKDGYAIVVHQPVRSRALLARPTPFVQMTWTPAAALPARIADAVDVDGDGSPDLVARFDVPADTTAPLFVDVTPLGDRVGALAHASRGDLSGMIVRVAGRILVRVPLARR
jgi:hypothetical protein